MFAILYFRTVIHRNFLAYYIVGFCHLDIQEDEICLFSLKVKKIKKKPSKVKILTKFPF
jgi:hypothetical protein